MRWSRVVAASVALLLVAHLLDGWAWTHLVAPEVYEQDRGRLLRIVGYLPTWFLLGAARWLHARDTRGALQLALLPAAGGLVAEVLKLLIRRERPGLHDGEYVFRAFTEQPWSTKALGMPSSHALVAFTGTFVLMRLFPRAWPVWLLLGAGCALTRVQAHAHFLSDVVLAAIAGWVLVAVAWREPVRA